MSKLVFVRFLPIAGQEQAVEGILRSMVRNTRQEPGNRLYDFYRSLNGEGRAEFNLLERYADDAAVQAHRDTEHYKAYRAAIMPLLDGPIAVTMLDPLDERAR